MFYFAQNVLVSQIDDANVHATSLICKVAPKQAAVAAGKEKAVMMFDSWK